MEPVTYKLADPVSYSELEEYYTRCVIGGIHPRTMIVSYRTFSQIRSSISFLQRIGLNDQPFNAIYFGGAIIYRSRWQPDNTVRFEYDEYDEFKEWAREVREKDGKSA